jgi:hypothetical protein
MCQLGRFGRSVKAPAAVAVFTLAFALSHGAEAQTVRNTVGLNGNFATIQAGINACGPGTICTVDVEAGTYAENLDIPSSLSATSIDLVGGWDATFTTRNPDASSTTIDGGNLDRTILLRYAGDFGISGFTITGGTAVGVGGGIWVAPSGASSASISLFMLEITSNQATSASGYAYGGGVRAELDGTENLEIERCEIFANIVSVTAGSGAASGGGISIAASGNATFVIEASWIEENEAASDTAEKSGAGHFLSAIEDSSGELIGVMVSGNTAAGAEANVSGSGGQLYASGNGQITVRRSAWALNTDATGDQSEQLRVTSSGASTIRITDSAMVLGDGHGMVTSSSDSSLLQLTNLTLADNAAYGVLVNDYHSSSVSLYNSIAYGNGTDAGLGAGVAQGNNLVGVDPHFMAPGPPRYNYRLDGGSPGLDSGTNTPPGGFGAADLDNRPRLENGTVDIGCYEGAGLLFLDGFESSGTGEWDSVVP